MEGGQKYKKTLHRLLLIYSPFLILKQQKIRYIDDVIYDRPASGSMDDEESDEDAHEEEDEHRVLHELDVLAVVARGRLWSIYVFGNCSLKLECFTNQKKTV